MKNARHRSRLGLTAIAATLMLVLAGCDGHHDEFAEFNAGYADGFADDVIYYDGYDDGWFTLDFGPILYQGDDIPFIEDFSFDAGFFDGQFDAYNDGYFVEYRNAFIIGFSEGYDNAFWSDYLLFLATDQHTEYLTGGFSDGYYDGFSEGRVFGAFDFEAFLPFDWLDAYLDWEGGLDLFFDEVGVGTGVFGPVELYVWGTDPDLLRAEPRSSRSSSRAGTPTMRTAKTKSHNGILVRPLTDAQIADLQINPLFSPRTNRELTLLETWLQRIQAYENAAILRTKSVERAGAANARRIQ